MPGCRENTEDMIHAVKSVEEKDGYKITLADLQSCAKNVLHIVAKTIKKEKKRKGVYGAAAAAIPRWKPVLSGKFLRFCLFTFSNLMV